MPIAPDGSLAGERLEWLTLMVPTVNDDRLKRKPVARQAIFPSFREWNPVPAWRPALL
jgi:hypothetical protein